MIRIWRFEISPINPASFFAFERSERQRQNNSRQSRNAKLFLIALAALGALASCTQYREPQANCFSFLASTAATAQDCHFAPLGAPEGDVEV